MAIQQFVNNYVVAVAADFSAVSTNLQLTSTAGLPVLTGGDYLFLTLYRLVGSSEQGHEVVKVTAINGNNCTVERSVEGAVASAFSAGDQVEARLTAKGILAKADIENTQALLDQKASIVYVDTQDALKAPLTGVGASGTWPISVTGSATTAGNVTGTVALANGGTGSTTAAGAKTNLALNLVDNKSSATIRGEITSANITTPLGYTPSAAAIGFIGSVAQYSMRASDLRNVPNPLTGVGYGSGMRVRFASSNDVDSTEGYADVIDMSTYQDSTGGGFNSIYFKKSVQQIYHKHAIAGGTSWTVKTIAYTDSSITGNAATANKLLTARTINGVSFDGTVNITLAKADIGLGNVDNTSDVAKPVSTAQATAIALKAPLTGTGTSGTWPISITGTATTLLNFVVGTRSTADVNTHRTSGMYALDNVPANAPPGYAYGSMLVAANLDVGLQIVGGYNSDKLAFRGWWNSGANFGLWREIIHAGNIGVQTVNAADKVWITTDDAYATPVYLTFNRGGAQYASQYNSSKLSFIPSSGQLTAVTFVGAGTGLTGTASGLSIGGNAATVGGASISQTATANSIVQRDAGGYIWGSYINMVDDGLGGTSGTVSSIITKRGDNYYRSTSAASVKTFLAIDQVSNTADASKPVSTAQAAAIALKADLNGSSTQNFNMQSLNGGPLSGFRNRIINGDMRVDQRFAGTVATVAFNTAQYTVDRWTSVNNRINGGSLVCQQDTTDVPAGFGYALKVTNSTAGAVVASDVVSFQHAIEGLNTSDLDWGKATAKPLTISFWAKSSVAGTYSVALRNGATSRAYVATYALTANTWTYVVLAVPGETSGIWNINTAVGMFINWDLGIGSTYSTATIGSWVSGSNVFASTTSVKLSATAGAIFRLTGVQVEVGSVATPFEVRGFGQELALCQRYFCKTFSYSNAVLQGSGANGGLFYSGDGTQSAYHGARWTFPQTMRIPPTINTYNYSAGGTVGYWHNAAGAQDSAPGVIGLTDNSLFMGMQGATPFVMLPSEAWYIHVTATAEL